MIEFFRKIRKKMLTENKFSKYLIYAIGEIILVVIGILIALSINNWNSKQTQFDLEIQYLHSLKEEFSNNLEELKRTKNGNAENIVAAVEIANHTGPEPSNITDKEFSILFFKTTNNEVQYRPGNGIINEIISSGKLSIISNLELKKALASLDGLILKIRFQENEEVGAIRKKLIDLASDEVSLRRMSVDAYGESSDLTNGKFLNSNLGLLQSRKFDNHLNGFIATSGYLQDGYYNQLEKQLNRIIRIVDEQLNSK